MDSPNEYSAEPSTSQIMLATELRKASTAVYIAVESDVANQLSALLSRAAGEVLNLASKLEAQEKEHEEELTQAARAQHTTETAWRIDREELKECQSRLDEEHKDAMKWSGVAGAQTNKANRLEEQVRELSSRLDSVRRRIPIVLAGIDQDEPFGWWETSKGADFGKLKLAEIDALFDSPDAP